MSTKKGLLDTALRHLCEVEEIADRFVAPPPAFNADEQRQAARRHLTAAGDICKRLFAMDAFEEIAVISLQAGNAGKRLRYMLDRE